MTSLFLRAEHRLDALGVASATPRLSWKTETAVPSWRQCAYQVELTRSGELQRTKVIESADSVLIDWPFAPLRSRERVLVRARVWGPSGEASPWSDPLEIELGLQEAQDWTGRFIAPEWRDDASLPQPAPYFRHEFDVTGDVVQARLHVTALGVYEAYVNGQIACDHVLSPGWTSYDHRLRVQVLDVGSLLRPGRNALGAILGDGWYRGRLGPHGGRRNIYGDMLALLAQLEVTYGDGSSTTIATNANWRATTGPILSSDLYDGEAYDARLDPIGWADPGYNDQGWSPVRELDRDLTTLVAATGPPVRRVEQLPPIEVKRSPSGRTLCDFGQNVTGRLRINVGGSEGDRLTLRHAEILEDGELCVRPLRQAAATDRYTLRGTDSEIFEPRFTFHGFRYAELSSESGTVDFQPENVRAVVCHSDVRRTGTFECSSPLVNRLHENVVWSMRGNFLDVPTDCAQRDERLGWTGDIQIFCPAALFLYDVAGFLTSWLADLKAEQDIDGRVPNVVPEVLDGLRLGKHDHDAPAAAWGDAAVIVPWTIYRFTGDRGILAVQYESMRRWVELVERLAGPSRLWDSGFQYGDWLDPTAPPDEPEHGQTEPSLVATAYFARSADLLSRVSRVLGRASEAARYSQLRNDVAAAFRNAYMEADGRLSSDSATAYALALCFDLVEDRASRDAAGARLAQIVGEADYRITTGFIGTPLVCDALCAVGAEETAYRLLMQEECPSWLYPLTMGATTIWERWDALLPDGSVNPGEMTSFNHYAFGAIADWLHRTVAGLAPAEPGFRRIAIAPRPGGGLTYARATHESPYGRIEVGWHRVEDKIKVEALVPPNATATVQLPDGTPSFEVEAGAHEWLVSSVEPIRASVPASVSTG